jgi:hypothetical protein
LEEAKKCTVRCGMCHCIKTIMNGEHLDDTWSIVDQNGIEIGVIEGSTQNETEPEEEEELEGLLVSLATF